MQCNAADGLFTKPSRINVRETVTVILAAGKGTRMKSNLVKVLHPLMGEPMLSFPIEVARKINSQDIILVTGYQAELIRERFKGEGLTFVEQKEQLGTGHAVLCTKDTLKDFKGDILILCGDVPLIKEDTVRALIEVHQEGSSAVTVLTTKLPNPEGYGRIIRGDDGGILRIVEERDATDLEKEVKEVNTGIYCAKASYLFQALQMVGRENKQSEYYLTDIVAIATEHDEKVKGFLAEDPFEVMGINNREELAKANEVIRREILYKLMMNGVGIIAPQTTFIERDVRIGIDTVIYPNCYIQGNSQIGKECIIEPGSMITNSIIGDSVIIKTCCVISDSKIANRVIIGPFAHLRPDTELEDKVKIGNFVEIKKTKIGEGSKASHLSYLGDATLGRGVNVGAGTITCNYDGLKKNQTIIEDNVFIGSDTQFVAPVKIGEGAYIGAGSTITEDVPSGSLALSRAKQVTKKRKREL
ncbi:MAG TPA: bifunctional UDP-N-acetylglucosamine diphosphorylase/glucosamine-1-phosphate N-acetyltransferase GlmU [Deltaproteobacteria bacterium]|nr:bifunctional UDP-N-acetylglucosamine diphosphorylase/glucosamine-1-phosphate N-acetyltransferase GlmU [Deltaproteobacteria bacterium]